MAIALPPHTQVLPPLPERSAAQGLRAAGVWGGAACPRGGPGQRQTEGDSETAGDKWGGTGTSLPLGRRGSGDGLVTSPRELERSQTCSGSGAGWGIPPPPARALPWAQGPAGEAGRADQAGLSRGQPAAERGRGGTSHAACGDPPPARQRQRPSLSAQPWLGRAPIPAVPSGCARLLRVGCHVWDALSWHPRTGASYPQHPHPHLAAVHDLQLRGLTPLRGPGTRGGTLAAARPGFWLRDPAGETRRETDPAGSAHLGDPARRPSDTDTSRSPRETNPSALEDATPRTPGLPRTPRALPGEERSTGGLAKQDGSGTAPRPGAGGDVTRSSRLRLRDPGTAPGSQHCGEKSGGLSPGLGGERSRGDVG